MDIPRALSSLAIITLASACNAPSSDTATADGEIAKSDPIAVGQLQMADGTTAGTAIINSDGDTASLTVTAQNIAPGPHGFHLHQVGSCAAPDFKSAGGHLNPLGKAHGSMADGGSHVGDLPNLEIAADGTGTLTTPIQGDIEQVADWIHDEDGTAVMIHVDADDYITDPTGNAGGRLACGILTKGE